MGKTDDIKDPAKPSTMAQQVWESATKALDLIEQYTRPEIVP